MATFGGCIADLFTPIFNEVQSVAITPNVGMTPVTEAPHPANELVGQLSSLSIEQFNPNYVVNELDREGSVTNSVRNEVRCTSDLVGMESSVPHHNDEDPRNSTAADDSTIGGSTQQRLVSESSLEYSSVNQRSVRTEPNWKVLTGASKR